MSRVCRDRKSAGVPGKPSRTDAQPAPLAPSLSKTSSSDSDKVEGETAKSKPTMATASGAKDTKAPAAAKGAPGPNVEVDTSVSSTMLAMMQAGVIPAPILKPAPTALLNSTLVAEDAAGTRLDAAPVTAESLPTINAASLTPASMNERGPLLPSISPGARSPAQMVTDGAADPFQGAGSQDQQAVESAPVREKLPEGRALENSVSMIPAANPTDNTLQALLDSAISRPTADAVPPMGPPVGPVEASGTPPQSVVAQMAGPAIKAVDSPDSSTGTGSALNEERMNFVAEKNETAGRTGQKVPRVASVGAAPAVSEDKSAVKALPGLFGGKKEILDSGLAMDFSAKPVISGTEQSAARVSAPVPDLSPAARVANLVNQEVLTIRQSGATSLAVSLKLDAHTELSLQLTNHDGQIQASIRCERGNLAGLDGHWGELQESLARQNVQLLPLDKNPSAPTTAASSLPFPSASSSAFNQSPQNSRQQPRELPQDFDTTVSTSAKQTSANPKTKSRSSSRQGWESWA
jgi:hypothetical protein